jgi:putative oxidoreductase
LIPSLASLFQTLAPSADALLRITVGLALVPHGLRNTFGFFPNSGMPALSLSGPLLALGLFTRPVAAVVLVFLLVTNVERWRVGKYFWNRLGLEYTLMWTIAAFYVFVHGGGFYSLDYVVGWEQ